MMMGSTPVAKLLLSYGADPNVADGTGATPLHDAARGGFLDTVETLVQHDANVHARDTSGRRAIDLALENGHEDVVAFLETQDVLV
ncbi:CDN2D inhibitor, partial [Amia calva]|nr:CDN2D inhibitor [Amia calva]